MTTADECLPFGLERFTEYIRNVKAAHVVSWAEDTDDPDSEPDLVPCCQMVWEDLGATLTIIAPEMDVLAIVWAIHALGVTAPTSVTLVSDAKIGTDPINPDTGTADAMLYLTVWRNGRRRHTIESYVADKHNGTLVWADPTHTDSGDGDTVDIPLMDVMRDALFCECAAPAIALGEALGVDRLGMAKHGLAMLMPKLAERGFLQAFGTEDQHLAEYIAVSVPGASNLE